MRQAVDSDLAMCVGEWGAVGGWLCEWVGGREGGFGGDLLHWCPWSVMSLMATRPRCPVVTTSKTSCGERERERE